jgi:hydroxymethylglutaryl-CoA lyase
MPDEIIIARQIDFVEVSPRDGLQNEAAIVSTEDKVELIRRSIASGVRRIEVASFAHPARVPQMADAEAVIAALPRHDDVVYIGLVLNKRGALRALATSVDELGAVCVATDSFANANQGQTSLESLEMAKDVVRFAKAEGRRAQITIGAAFGCPFEGEVDPDHVVAMARSAAEAGPVEIALADTIGVAVPAQVSALITRVAREIGPIPVRAHFHNTRGTGIANVWAAIEAGARTIDASIGGLGGCPFAPGAAGNVASEDVAYLLQRSGIDAGIELDALIETSKWLGGIMGRTLPGMLSRVGRFPVAA